MGIRAVPSRIDRQDDVIRFFAVRKRQASDDGTASPASINSVPRMDYARFRRDGDSLLRADFLTKPSNGRDPSSEFR